MQQITYFPDINWTACYPTYCIKHSRYYKASTKMFWTKTQAAMTWIERYQTHYKQRKMWYINKQLVEQMEFAHTKMVEIIPAKLSEKPNWTTEYM